MGAIRYNREVTAEALDPLAVFAGSIPEGASVLDLGCGPGVLGRTVRAARDAVFDGVECDAEAARAAREHYRRVIEADLQTACLEHLFEGRRYDYVVLADVLQQLEAPGLVVRQIPSVLNPGGRILISIPNVGYAGLLASLLAGRFDYDKYGILDYAHLRFFTRASFHRFLNLNGMRVAAERDLSRPLSESRFPPASLEALDPRVRLAIVSAPDAMAFQFLMEAVPAPELRREDSYQALVDRNVTAGSGDLRPFAGAPGAPSEAGPESLFDAGYYLYVYPDVAAAGLDPYRHYIQRGAAEGRNPHILFDTAYYLRRYPDVTSSGMNPLRHYFEVGAGEARDPHPLFDARFYLRQYPDVAARKANPLSDFVSRQGAAARRPHVLFDTAYYLRENPDVAEAPTNPLVHYLMYGWIENRNPHILFDTSFYRAQCGSQTGEICPLRHYVESGSRLGLKPHPYFDGAFYLRQHPELAGTGESALAHYLRLGYRLHYDPNPDVNAREYLEHWADSVPPAMSVLEHMIVSEQLVDWRGRILRKADADPPRVTVSTREPSGASTAEPRDSGRPDAPLVQAIAFYLPQYHPIPENDLWWGEGFTDWHNVARAKPSFAGHNQPRVPADLGYYDLRSPSVMERQAELAREAGIYGFCFYHYRFGDRKLLERPVEQMLARRSPDFPFCICWANETWTRVWEGSSHEILIEQQYPDGFAEKFIRDALPVLTAPNYIRAGGAPLLLVYRIDQIPDARRVADVWRRTLQNEAGLELHLALVEDERSPDPASVGFDSVVEFTPRAMLFVPPAPSRSRRQEFDPRTLAGLRAGFGGCIEDYRALVRRMISRPPPEYVRHRCVMPGWDNTARWGPRARIVINEDAGTYGAWLRFSVEQSLAGSRKHNPLVFIFAWNEWAEGAYLEPDRKNGNLYLRATREALYRGTLDYYRTAGADVTLDGVRETFERQARHAFPPA
jgi:methionine biosynthesis protein MetW